MKEINFLFEKNIIVKLKYKTIFALMCFVMNVDCLIQFTLREEIFAGRKFREFRELASNSRKNLIFCNSQK